MENPFFKAVIWLILMIFITIFSLGYIPYPFNFIIAVLSMIFLIKKVSDIFISYEAGEIEFDYKKKIRRFVREVGEIKVTLIVIALLVIITIPVYEHYSNFQSLNIDMREFKLYHTEKDGVKKYYFQILYVAKAKNPNIHIYVKDIGLYIDGKRIFEINERYRLEVWQQEYTNKIMLPLNIAISPQIYTFIAKYDDSKKHVVRITFVIEQEFFILKLSRKMEQIKLAYIIGE